MAFSAHIEPHFSALFKQLSVSRKLQYNVIHKTVSNCWWIQKLENQQKNTLYVEAVRKAVSNQVSNFSFTAVLGTSGDTLFDKRSPVTVWLQPLHEISKTFLNFWTLTTCHPTKKANTIRCHFTPPPPISAQIQLVQKFRSENTCCIYAATFPSASQFSMMLFLQASSYRSILDSKFWSDIHSILLASYLLNTALYTLSSSL